VPTRSRCQRRLAVSPRRVQALATPWILYRSGARIQSSCPYPHVRTAAPTRLGFAQDYRHWARDLSRAIFVSMQWPLPSRQCTHMSPASRSRAREERRARTGHGALPFASVESEGVTDNRGAVALCSATREKHTRLSTTVKQRLSESVPCERLTCLLSSPSDVPEHLACQPAVCCCLPLTHRVDRMEERLHLCCCVAGCFKASACWRRLQE
jgi:hypothetical protein